MTPPWVLRTVPETENALKLLRSTPCHPGCAYCRKALDLRAGLKRIFHFDAFRTYNGEPLQERAAQAAMEGKSLLAVFPTGGGKSLTFQLPALLQGEAFHALTVVISPLQSLMKDQVDHLERAGITRAVTINGLMSPVERADACARVLSGSASLLYISPEVRSRTVERLLLPGRWPASSLTKHTAFPRGGRISGWITCISGILSGSCRRRSSGRRPSRFPALRPPPSRRSSATSGTISRKLGLDLKLFAPGPPGKTCATRCFIKETDEEKYEALRS